MANRITRRVYSDVHGHTDPATVDDDEICLIISNAARVGLLKLLGKQSRDSLQASGLTDAEIEAVDSLSHHLQ